MEIFLKSSSMLVTAVGGKFEMLVTDCLHWKTDQHNQKATHTLI